MICIQAADDSHRSLHLQSRQIKCISTDVTFRKMKQNLTNKKLKIKDYMSSG